jgi:hypothetical protein
MFIESAHVYKRIPYVRNKLQTGLVKLNTAGYIYCMRHVGRQTEMHKVLWWISLKTRDHLHHIGLERRRRLKRMLKEYDRKPWAALI